MASMSIDDTTSMADSTITSHGASSYPTSTMNNSKGSSFRTQRDENQSGWQTAPVTRNREAVSSVGVSGQETDSDELDEEKFAVLEDDSDD
jgi:hypothetical protein